MYSADTNTVSPVRCPFDAPVRTYKLRGLDADEAAVTLEKFGKNSLRSGAPNFKTILKETAPESNCHVSILLRCAVVAR